MPTLKLYHKYMHQHVKRIHHPLAIVVLDPSQRAAIVYPDQISTNLMLNHLFDEDEDRSKRERLRVEV